MKKPSQLAFWIVSLLYILSAFYYQPWENALVGGADRWGYYAYLPAFFIHDDLETMDVSSAIRASYSKKGSASTKKNDQGKWLNQYTCGLAIMNTPAFALAHVFSKLSAFKSDGYSMPYNFSIVWSGLLYVLAGMYFLRFVLLRFFKEPEIAIALFLMGLGTNLYFTAVLQSAMAHAYLFFLVSCLLLLSLKWKESSQLKYLLSLAFIGGLIGLVRPNVIIICLFPLVYNWSQLVGLLKKPLILVLALICFLIPFIPQLLYWKFITGSFVYYSYGEQSFDFANPHIFDGLFSFRNGWLIYTPIMIFSLLGLILGLIKKNRIMFLVAAIFMLHIFVIYSWWCWNYINGFGSRAMVDIYPLLIIPFTYFFQRIRKFRKLRISILSITLLFVGLNIFQTYQFENKVLWSEEGTSAYYQSVFGKTKLDHDILVALDCNIVQPGNVHFKKSLKVQSFESLHSPEIDSVFFYNGEKGFCLEEGKKFSPGIQTSIPNVSSFENDWLRASTFCWSKAYSTFYDNSHLVITIKRGEEQLLWRSMRLNNKIREEYYTVHNGEINEWKEVAFFVPIKGLHLTSEDVISLYAWNPTSIPVCIDDIKLEIWGK